MLPEIVDGETFLIQTIGPETSGNNSSETSNADGEIVPCLAVAPFRDAQPRHGSPSREDVTGGQVPTPPSQSFKESFKQFNAGTETAHDAELSEEV